VRLALFLGVFFFNAGDRTRAFCMLASALPLSFTPTLSLPDRVGTEINKYIIYFFSTGA
jgi:hypothetical protein